MVLLHQRMLMQAGLLKKQLRTLLSTVRQCANLNTHHGYKEEVESHAE